MGQQKESVLTARSVTKKQNYQTTITSGNNTIIADEPADKGGADTGMDPFGLLLASLGSCTSITLRMYIDRKMWIVDEITVDLELFRTDDSVLIERMLSFKGELIQEQIDRLLQIADHCPIHKILTGNIGIYTTVA
ncbi:OsmC family protein [Mucilaginibacter sp. UR6-1]|uniref:OsmC family protein n=1 Tax=Mucilaginibacter sp. UR6-1 TaxID=1435643 RepID=UPI001E635B80|nr:OsmC family protein [Mucilaginibacter sp. UR6-1]MCC8407929.1 OsmC family protein [Mucilaginibacter sp. UR6-1]